MVAACPSGGEGDASVKEGIGPEVFGKVYNVTHFHILLMYFSSDVRCFL